MFVHTSKHRRQNCIRSVRTERFPRRARRTCELTIGFGDRGHSDDVDGRNDIEPSRRRENSTIHGGGGSVDHRIGYVRPFTLIVSAYVIDADLRC